MRLQEYTQNYELNTNLYNHIQTCTITYLHDVRLVAEHSARHSAGRAVSPAHLHRQQVPVLRAAQHGGLLGDGL